MEFAANDDTAPGLHAGAPVDSQYELGVLRKLALVGPYFPIIVIHMEDVGPPPAPIGWVPQHCALCVLDRRHTVPQTTALGDEASTAIVSYAQERGLCHVGSISADAMELVSVPGPQFVPQSVLVGQIR